MEVAGLAIGIASLSGVLTSTLECLEYLQLSLNFGKDYGRSLLKLDLLKLRITRWGMSVVFLATRISREQLCMSEVQQVHDNRNLALLNDVNANDDEIFDNAANMTLAERSGRRYENTKAGGEARLQQGHQIGSGFVGDHNTGLANRYVNTTLMERARAMQENRYGGEDFFGGS